MLRLLVVQCSHAIMPWNKYSYRWNKATNATRGSHTLTPAST